MQVSRKTICIIKNLHLVRKSEQRTFKLSADAITLDSSENIKIPFIGRSGEGKSTLLEALATMLAPTSGEILWKFYENNQLIDSFSWGDDILSAADTGILRTRYFGFAFQDTTLTPALTVLDNLIYPQKLLNPSQACEKALQRLQQVFTLEADKHIAYQYPHQLSGGQRQRVALLQAMVNDPFVLFADEPTGNLDVKTRKEVMQVIEDWQNKTGGMFIWVTHHESDVTAKRSHIKINNGLAEMV